VEFENTSKEAQELVEIIDSICPELTELE